jgi:hypothetical protein
MEKMDKELSNSIALANLNYSHQSALQGQAAAQRSAEAKQVAMDKIAAAQQEYQLALQREYNRYNNPDSAEFKIRAAQIEEARDQKIADAFTSAQVQAVAQGTTNDPALGYDVTEAPTDYTQSYGNGFVGNLFNLFTNYNTKASQWDAKQQAQTAKDAFLSNPVDYYNTYLKKGSGVSDVYENANIPVSDYQTLDDLFQD